MQVALGRGCEKPYFRFRPFREGLPQGMDESATAAARLQSHVEPAKEKLSCRRRAKPLATNN